MFMRISTFCLIAAVVSGSPRKPHQHLRIVGGNETTIEKHPWQVSLELLGIHSCGGSIVSADTIVTAAHCCDELMSLFYEVVVGTTDLLNVGLRVKVESSIIHENYSGYDYDVGLVKLAENLTFSDQIQPIKLAEAELPTGTPVTVSGWGVESENDIITPNILREVEVNIVDREVCSADYEGLENGDVTRRMICAGVENGGKDACQGDSGGPLSKDGVLYGIVSWGLGCGEPNYPGVYTNVADVSQWIKDHSGV